jgi:UDP-glucuronate 4-epimerase
MLYLITGVAGFIGAKTAQFALDNGVKIIGIDNINNYYSPIIKIHRLEELKKYQNFTFIKGDIEDKVILETIFKSNKIDAVINLAARAGVRYSLINPFIYASTNYIGTLNLLDLMRQFNVSKYVMASTSSIYSGSPMPFKESASVNQPISPYAASKKAAELIAYTYHHQFNLDVSIVRYFTVYGPSGRPDMSILRFIKWIDEQKPLVLYGDGSQSRDFTYIGGDNPIPINTLISKIEILLKKKALLDQKPFHSADVDSTWADITKAKKILNWEPKISLDEGLKKTVEWYYKNKSWLKEINFI